MCIQERLFDATPAGETRILGACGYRRGRWRSVSSGKLVCRGRPYIEEVFEGSLSGETGISGPCL